MYLHMQDWQNAMRVAETYEQRCVVDVYTAQAKELSERKGDGAQPPDLQRAEMLFLQARKPELAIGMYKDHGKMSDAMRVARAHLPSAIPGLENAQRGGGAHMAGGGMGGGGMPSAGMGSDLTSHARQLEQQGRYSEAIDAYLAPTKVDTSDLDSLEQAWETGVKLAMSHVQDRIPEVMSLVSSKLIGISRFAAAADLYEGFQMYKEAIDVYIQGGMRDEAISLAQRRAPQFTEYAQDTAESNVSNHMQNNIPMMGGGSGSLDQLMQRGDWDQLMHQAQREGGEVLTKYTVHYAKHLVQQQDFLGAIGALNQFGISTQPACFDLYKRIAHEIMVLEVKESNLKPLKEVLHKLLKALEGLPGHDDFKKLLLVVHFLSQRQTCVNSGLGEFGWKLAVSLARYCNDLAADRIFYDAGEAARAMGVNNMAFVFFNRFLDLTEAIDDPETGMMDNADFADTDVPFDFPLPDNHTVSEDQREEVRNWVLQISMDHTAEQTLTTRSCQNCGTHTYEGNLQCHSCKFEHQACIVTGYPVLAKEAVKCTSCSMPANRNDWNSYVSRMTHCPWCGSNQNASYM